MNLRERLLNLELTINEEFKTLTDLRVERAKHPDLIHITIQLRECLMRLNDLFNDLLLLKALIKEGDK